ncbi:BrnT family toxin [Novosphingobium sp. AP12]|uniref:BrnT family toxin n=1 Tax=Novosphingobium sp. AP12 TaxID=1144305 RepID=UPI000271FBD7|nr:BrnT family toxin [Novosphingobium sp. AP12]EJL21125.1 hypothetical protein PMI02_05195 [Novosphingobium sp. AP12]
MEIEFDEAKRSRTLAERGLDFADAPLVFANEHFDLPDERIEYGEERYLTFGWLKGRAVTIVWTPRGLRRRIISMRFVHGKELRSRKRGMD